MKKPKPEVNVAYSHISKEICLNKKKMIYIYIYLNKIDKSDGKCSKFPYYYIKKHKSEENVAYFHISK